MSEACGKLSSRHSGATASFIGDRTRNPDSDLRRRRRAGLRTAPAARLSGQRLCRCSLRHPASQSRLRGN